MSLARGRGARTRGSGGGEGIASRGASTSRGFAFQGSAQRGSTASGRGARGQASRSNAPRASRGFQAPARLNGSHTEEGEAGAFGGSHPLGNWGDRFEALTKARGRERAGAILQGLIADPDRPRSLAEAITPVGTCRDMCAEFERVQRAAQNDVWREEMSVSQGLQNNGKPEPDESRMVKKFRRAAAGLEEQLPSDLRPPFVLKQTCDYLFDEVVGHAPALEKVHHFVWDRTRAVRNDFSIQQLTKAEDLRTAIDCYERIARFHILSLHQLAVHPRPYDNYDAQQEREQLDRTLLSLMQYYDDSRGQIDLPNESEFRAYCVIFQLQDPIPDMEDRAQTWPRHIMKDGKVRKALDLYAAACNTADAQGPLKPRARHPIAQQDFRRFWTLVDSKQVSYLMACVAEIYFNLVRRTTLNAISRGFRQRAVLSPTDFTPDLLRELFMLDDDEQVHTFCEAYGFSFAAREDNQEEYLDLRSMRSAELPQPSANLPKQWRSHVVEDKRFGRTLPSIINGMTVRQAQQAGLVVEEDQHEQEAVMEDAEEVIELPMEARSGPFEEESNDQATDDEQSLFVPQAGKINPTSTQPQLTNGFGTGSKTAGPVATGPASFSFGKPSGDSLVLPTTASDGVTPKPPQTSFPVSKPLFDFLTRPGAPAPNAPVSAGAAGKPSFNFLATPSVPSSSVASSVASKPQSQATKSSFSFEPPVFDRNTAFSFSQPTADAQVKPAVPINSVFAAPPPANGQTKPYSFSSFQQTPDVSSSVDKVQDPNETLSTMPPGAVWGQQTNAEGATSLPSQMEQPETRPSQVHFTSPSLIQGTQPTKPASPSISVERRNSLNKTYKPPKPSPLAHASSLEDVTVPTAEELFTRLAKEVFHAGVSGFLDQYIEYTVRHAIMKAQEQVHAERANAQADSFRVQVLQHRYGRKWRERVWRTKSAARASQRRERARKGLEETRSRATSVMTGSRASSVGLDRQQLVGVGNSMFQRTNMNGLRLAGAASERQIAQGIKRPLSSHASNAPTHGGSSHKRQKSTSHVDERGRVSKSTHAEGLKADLLRRSAFLGYSASGPGAALHQRSTTQTNYFRLKALGLGPSPEATDSRGTKRRRSESFELGSKDAGELPAAHSSPSRSIWQPKAMTKMPPPVHTPKKDNGDEALFARLKAARENLAKSAILLKDDVAREQDLRRSLSASQSSNESPSMARARAEARWRASENGGAFGTRIAQEDGPAYRYRESRFVPREHYAKAVERANQFRQSRSREASERGSRFDEFMDDSFASTDNHESHHLQQQLGGGDSRDQTSRTPNGVASTISSIPRWEPPSTTTAPSAAPHVLPRTTWSFADAENQPSGMLEQAILSEGYATPAPQPMFDAVNGRRDLTNLDYTVQPSQVEQTLANSFGASQAFGQASKISSQWSGHTLSLPHVYDSTHAAAEAMSLLSDDGDGPKQPLHMAQFAQAPAINGVAEDTDDAELLDEGEEEEVPDSYQYTNSNMYASNPYSALADEFGADTEEDPEAENQSQSAEGSLESEGEEGAPRAPNGHYIHNGYVDDEEGDGDIEDAEEYDEEEEDYDEEDGLDAAVPARRRQRFVDDEEDEDSDGFEEEEEEEADGNLDPSLGAFRQAPSINPALLAFGGTAEGAIELSD
ncbi:actin cytoskeleton and mitosis protein [Friedmanniomyces endolithicus]|nr:actin cytoskeleton and mitosis protein [Friedmanniomyces endolithicus]KAK0832779.1 actin cytoskeleton and mitosis protein [Friedmanniomyces endolithicus]